MNQREIKFRAWEKAEKRMAPVASIHFGGDGSARTVSVETAPLGKFYRPFIAGENCVLMQFTGLKDKNGNEIYEGDVIKTREMNRGTDTIIYGMPGILLSRPQEVRFEQGGFYPIAGWMEPDDMEWEVIGNVYEDPELLT